MDGLGAPRGRREKTAAERRPQGRRAEARCVQRLLVAFTSVVEHRGNQVGILSLALAQLLSPAFPKAPTAVDSAAVASAVPSRDVPAKEMAGLASQVAGAAGGAASLQVSAVVELQFGLRQCPLRADVSAFVPAQLAMAGNFTPGPEVATAAGASSPARSPCAAPRADSGLGPLAAVTAPPLGASQAPLLQLVLCVSDSEDDLSLAEVAGRASGTRRLQTPLLVLPQHMSSVLAVPVSPAQRPVQSWPSATFPRYPSPLRRDVLSMLWAAVTSAWVASPAPSLAHAQAHGIVSRLRRASSTQRPEIAAAVLTYCAARTHAASPAVVVETWLECQRLVLDRWPPCPDETQWREPGGGTVV